MGDRYELASAMAAVASAAAQGAVTPCEAMQFGHVIEAYVRAVEATEFEQRLRTLEAADVQPACRHTWRAAAAIGTVIRSALARAGVDAAQATRLCLADEAAAALAAPSHTPGLERVDGDSPAPAEAQDRGRTDGFNPKILTLARGFAGAPPPDFAKASFAELFAWSLAQPPAA